MATKKAIKKKSAKKAAASKKVAAPKKAVAAAKDNVDALNAVKLTASVELGRNRITLDDALNIGEQSLIELDKKVGDSVDILLNGKLFARGEIVTIGENFGVRLTEVLEEV